MFNIFRKDIDWGGKTISLETGKIARQADGCVFATMGETTVLCTAVAAKKARPGQDFFPLTVNYQEKAFAAGKIPGGFFKREGRPSENETLVSRLIDRPIRPLFTKEFKCETQVICTVLSHDMENNPDTKINETLSEDNNQIDNIVEEESAPMLFSDEKTQENPESENLDQNDESLDLFDQETNEDEDFEIPAFLRRQKF